MGFAVALLRVVVAFQSTHRQTQRVGRGPALLRLGFGALQVDLRRQAAGLQAREEFGLLIGRPRRHLPLAVPRPRLVEGDTSGMPGVAQRLLFGGDGRAQRLDLRRERERQRACSSSRCRCWAVASSSTSTSPACTSWPRIRWVATTRPATGASTGWAAWLISRRARVADRV